jgi:hypothetical protein
VKSRHSASEGGGSSHDARSRDFSTELLRKAVRFVRKTPTRRDEDVPKHPAPEKHDETWRDGALSIADAKAFSSLSRSELYRQMDRGLLAWSKLGRRRVIARRSLVELLERGA